MFYRKAIISKRPKKLRLSITDFSGGINKNISEDILPQRYAVMAYNFTSVSGALRNAKGIDKLKLKSGVFEREVEEFDKNIIKIYYYKRFDPDLQKYDDKLVVYCDDKNLYYQNIDGGSSFNKISGARFEASPVGINYKLNGDDVLILSSEKDAMTVWDGRNPAYTINNAPHISSMCVHYERLFTTVDGEKSAVWFSDDLDPTNWDVSLDEAGFIEIADERGALIKVLQFLDYVYIFRSYGISRLTAYSEQTQFSLIPLYISSGKIYPQTVTVCGDRIIFLAEDGFYMFNGISTVKIMDNIFPMLSGINNSNAVSAFYNGAYYIACKVDYGDDDTALSNNTLIEYDIVKASATFIRGVDVCDIKVITSEGFSALALAVSGSGQVATLTQENVAFGRALFKCWTTPTTDFGYPDKTKMIREIYVSTATDIKVAVITDMASKIINIPGGKSVKPKKINIRGKTLKLSFLCGEKLAEISKPLLIVDVL